MPSALAVGGIDFPRRGCGSCPTPISGVYYLSRKDTTFIWNTQIFFHFLSKKNKNQSVRAERRGGRCFVFAGMEKYS